MVENPERLINEFRQAASRVGLRYGSIEIKQNTDRDNFYLNAADRDALDEFERYTRGRLGPVFEGG